VNSNSTKTRVFLTHLPVVPTAERQTRMPVSEGETGETVDLVETFLLLVLSVARLTLFLLNQKGPTCYAVTALRLVKVDKSVGDRS
jgi:hypothetical protein